MAPDTRNARTAGREAGRAMVTATKNETGGVGRVKNRSVPSRDEERPAMREQEQRSAALREANRIRVYRSAVKKRIAAGTLTPFTALNDPDLATMRVVDLLVAVPRVGRLRARRILRMVGTSESRHVGELSPRQRVGLAGLLGGKESE